PAEGRHSVVEGWKRLAGQVALDPSQVSATSHTPAEARHTVPALPAGCVQAGAPTVPLHTSLVQTMPSSVQAVPAVLTASAGQVVLEPVQLSARSHSLCDARHNMTAGSNVRVEVQQDGDWPLWSHSDLIATLWQR